MTQDQPRGVHLTDKHIVFGVMAGSVVAVLAFLCGVFVGRGVLAARPASTESATVAGMGVEADATAVSDGESATSPSGTGDGSASSPPANLTYVRRLTKPELPAESMKTVVQPPPPSPALEEPPDAAPAAGGAERPPAAGAPGPGPFFIQIAAVHSRAEAQSIVDGLLKKGYPAFVYVPVGGDRTSGYRVRVGTFKSRAEAEPMASRLQKAEQYKPWITR